MAEEVADFSGWATKNGLKCTDGRTIMPDAFKHQDGVKVPLVWQHGHDTPENILGHAILENREEGVYTYAYLNSTSAAQDAKIAVEHGDITFFSIYANKLVERSKQVYHGAIREVSLVLAGANPGALIDQVRIAHSDGEIEELEEEAIIYTGLTIEHADKPDETPTNSDEKSVRDVYNSMNEEQKEVVHFMIGKAVEGVDSSVKHTESEDEKSEDDKSEDAPEDDASEEKSDDESTSEDTESEDDQSDDKDDNLENQEGEEMTHKNVFEDGADTKQESGPTLTHSQIATIWEDGKKRGSFKESLLEHAEDYGITNIEMLFPDARAIDNKPEWITRRMEWVETVLNGTRKLPFSKIKSLSADLTHEEARAKGYIKSTMKKEQFFEIAKRETGPKTIYKKQKLDRDDITDITDFDVVSWLWVEMRFMLREEIARAVLIGDGREVDDPDKIDQDKIRPIAHDSTFYTDVVTVASNISPEDLVETVIRNREAYKGSGEPTAFMTRAVMNDMLLQRDRMGRRLYRNRGELAAELEVSGIVLVPVLEGAERDGGEILMVLVNLSDYSIGSTKGGEVTTFEDFDIDYNQHKYLIEGRMSGALTKHKTAQVFLRGTGTIVPDGTDAGTDPGDPSAPTFVNATGVLTIPSQTGVQYYNDDTDALLSSGAQSAIAIGNTFAVRAEPASGYYFAHDVNTDWTFTRTA